MSKLIECVPNFSEGRDKTVIKRITDEIERVEGVSLLNVDMGKATNRTVVTFVGEPGPVVEAAFRAVKMAASLIDMSGHKGEHPRFGATDVCPLVPVADITMGEVVEYARELARRIGEELNIPVYCYEEAALIPMRKNLSLVRSGEYEGLKEKLADPQWKPDFGGDTFNPAAGATAVGARDFLVAYNINLNTTSTRRANAVAFDVRERGRVKRKGDPLTGEIVKDAKGEPVMVPGSLPAVKAIGWYIEEYGIAQISMNLTNIGITPIHIAFDEVFRKAEERGLRVTGSELVGMVPLKAMLDAGRYYLKKQKRSLGIPDAELIRIAVKSMGLDDLYPFEPERKIIEYMTGAIKTGRLAGMSLREFMEETSSESPAPGGGSISAYIGSLGAALAGMVANLSAHKKGWDERWEEFSDRAAQAKQYQEELLVLVDRDTAAFSEIMNAYGLPRKTIGEKERRHRAIQEATREAIQVPFRMMEIALDAMQVTRAMAETGNPNSVSDAGVGMLALRACIRGAFLNVKINCRALEDKTFCEEILGQCMSIDRDAEQQEIEIMRIVNDKL